MVDQCPGCGLTFERIEGHWIGAVGMNTMVTFGAVLATVIIGFVSTRGDPNPVALSLIALTVAILVPIAFYPVSKTLWTAIDILMRPINPGELDPAFRIRGRQPGIPPPDGGEK